MTPLSLTALVHEGPIARAYLSMLHAEGYRLDRIVLMVAKRDLAHGTPVAPWLPTQLRRRVARVVQDLRMNNWPREFLRTHGNSLRPWLQEMASAYQFDPAAYSSLTERPDYARYADQVDEVLTDGLADPSLSSHLLGLARPSTILFTGGGMVPESLLSIPQCRFIHVHPGVLPNVRGADGLLWSLILRGRPGATAFYMSPGLDAGDIILSSDLDVPPAPIGLENFDATMAYRLLYAFVDPMLRAVLLRRVIDQARTQGRDDLFDLPTVAQHEYEGTTFNFMNKRLRTFAFDRWQALASARVSARPVQDS